MSNPQPPSDLRESVEIAGAPWRESDYYRIAEAFTFVFWDPDSTYPFFRPWFDRLDLRNVLELACGHGRHAERAAPLVQHLTLMDIHEENLQACRQRLGHLGHVDIVRNNGFDFQPVADASLSAIFCYDAMVHFGPDLVASYLRDTARVLEPGGMALYHHSNHVPADPTQHFGCNPHARNHMSVEWFASLATQAGLEVVDSRTFDWGEAVALDGLTLVRRP